MSEFLMACFNMTRNAETRIQFATGRRVISHKMLSSIGPVPRASAKDGKSREYVKFAGGGRIVAART
jgi:hypothetical protein